MWNFISFVGQKVFLGKMFKMENEAQTNVQQNLSIFTKLEFAKYLPYKSQVFYLPRYVEVSKILSLLMDMDVIFGGNEIWSLHQ